MNKQEMIRALDDEIAGTVLKRQDLTYREIAQLFGVGYTYVQNIVVARKLRRQRGLGSPAFKLKQKKAVQS
jgi:transposase